MIKDELALKIAGNYKNGVQEVFVDPVTISLCLSIIVNIVKLWKTCKNKPEEIQVSCKNPSKRDIAILKKQIRKELGFIRYYKEGQKYLDNTLNVAKDLTIEEIEQLIKEV